MEIKRLRTFAVEILKTLNGLNPEFMKSVFVKSTHTSHKKCNLKFPHQSMEITVSEPSEHISGTHYLRKQNLITSLEILENFIKNWYRSKLQMFLLLKIGPLSAVHFIVTQL